MRDFNLVIRILIDQMIADGQIVNGEAVRKKLENNWIEVTASIKAVISLATDELVNQYLQEREGLTADEEDLVKAMDDHPFKAN